METDHPRKCGVLTLEEKAIYSRIANSIPKQRVEYVKFLENVLGSKGQADQMQKAEKWKFNLSLSTGRLKYAPKFTPIDLPYEVTYVRHGKTEGNTEPRIYQGDVDYWENQLTNVGKEQAETAADRLETMMREEGWRPDIIVISPLTRARDTAAPFLRRYPDIPVNVHPGFKEMAFGCYDNIRVIDVPDNSIAHLFYLEQNAVFRAESDHTCKEGFTGRKAGEVIAAESFVDVIDRMGQAMQSLECPKVEGRKCQALFFGHSMAGAAVSMLLGHGQSDSMGYLCFDGSYIMPNATPTRLRPKLF